MKFDKTALGETAHRADVQISAWPVVQRGASPYKPVQPQDVYFGALRAAGCCKGTPRRGLVGGVFIGNVGVP